MIEWSRIDELRNMVGDRRFGDITRLFFHEIETELAGLRNGMVDGTLRQHLHSLKGGAASLGFQELSKRCEAAELAASQNQLEDADLKVITQTYQKSRVIFEQGLQQRLSA